MRGKWKTEEEGQKGEKDKGEKQRGWHDQEGTGW